MGMGTYVVAVSGGVDSVVLLHLLMQQYGSPVSSSQSVSSTTGDKRLVTSDSSRRFVVAHYDHGIRPDSADDRKFVQDIAKKHKLTFVHELGNLGPDTSEDTARKARYEFLKSVQSGAKAKAIITAHHQDDVLETAIMNILRGSGRRGLTALKTTDKLIRPLLGYSKDQIREYAQQQAIAWREDPSNTDTKYTRNHIRHNILTKLTPGQRAQFVILLDQLTEINKQIDEQLVSMLHLQPGVDELDRSWFTGLPHSIACEVIHAWLRHHKIKNINRKTVERLVIVVKTSKVGKSISVDAKHKLVISRNRVKLVTLK